MKYGLTFRDCECKVCKAYLEYHDTLPEARTCPCNECVEKRKFFGHLGVLLEKNLEKAGAFE